MKLNSVRYAISDFDHLHGTNLLTAVSYESRFIRSLERILESKRLGRITLLVFDDYFQTDQLPTSQVDPEAALLYRENYEQALKLLRNAGFRASKIRLALDDLPAFVSAIKASDTTDLIVDISTLPRAYILLMLRFAQPAPIALIYTCGKGRKTKEDAYTVGVSNVVALPGFEGKVGHKPTLLLVSLGYEGARAYTLFRQYEPTATLAFLGDPGTSDLERDQVLQTAKNNNANLLATDTVCYNVLPSYDALEFASRAAFFVDQMVDRIRRTHVSEDVDVIASPIGTKIQAVGLFQLWEQRQSYQVVYPIPSMRKLGTVDVGPTLVYSNIAG